MPEKRRSVACPGKIAFSGPRCKFHQVNEPNAKPVAWSPRLILRRCPWVVLVLIVPSWIAWAIMDRDMYDTGHLLFYYMPDLVNDSLRVVPNFLITPLINIETDQILLITVLIAGFGIPVEKRLGGGAATAIFWIASAAGAIGAGVLWHLVYPLFSDVHAVQQGAERIFNGASAGGFGLMAAYAALARRPLIWIGLFCIWEPGFWILVSRDFTSAFHVIAFVTGFTMTRLRIPRVLFRVVT